jgi:hypothetical protein
MTATWPDDALHGLLFVEASKLWRKSQRKSPWFRLLNWLFQQSVPGTLYIQEYSDADWETGACKGDVVRTWAFDDSGLRDAASPALDAASHTRFERLIYYAPPQGDKVTMTHFYSPFGGFGHILKVAARKGKPRLEVVKSWIF